MLSSVECRLTKLFPEKPRKVLINFKYFDWQDLNKSDKKTGIMDEIVYN